jgi:hypothetical protein
MHESESHIVLSLVVNQPKPWRALRFITAWNPG